MEEKVFYKRKFFWAIAYGGTLILFTLFLLLDMFVIPHYGASVEEMEKKLQEQGEGDFTEQEDRPSSEDISITENSYKDKNISIQISQTREYDSQIYMVEIKISSIKYLKTALAEGIFGTNYHQKTSEMAQAHNAILAINGDYYGARKKGYVVRNGVSYRSTSDGRENMVIYEDGHVDMAKEGEDSLKTLVENGAKQVFTFGPTLIKDSQIYVEENEEVKQSSTSGNPRTAFGMIEPLHYIIVVSDGRTTESKGLSLYQLADFIKNKGAVFAYNLDGGGTSTLWFNGEIINKPTPGKGVIQEREISDIVYFGY